MIFILDNYDSFTYNLVHLVGSFSCRTEVRRNDEISADEILLMNPSGILLSPGPCRPELAGCMIELIRRAAGRIPILGVCLGHQAVAAAFGGKIVSAKRIVHGKTSVITHDGRGVFAGVRQGFRAVRYHSLAVEESSLPDVLEISARSEDGEIMGIRHKKLSIEGIQYHPESILSECGKQQIANFLKMAGESC